ncbi:MAG: AMP-binding protein [Chloroflexota bacterium]
MTNQASLLVEVPAPPGFIPFPENADQIPVVEHVLGWVRKTPDHPALVENGSSVSYAELWANVRRVERALLKARGQKEEPIGLMFNRESEGVAALLAVMRAGKFFVVLDPASPLPYLQAICDDLDLKLILTNARYLDIAREAGRGTVEALNVQEMEEPASGPDPEAARSLDALAGVYYTSGSTGRPKGAVLDHRAMSLRVFGNCATLKYNPTDRICLPFSLGMGWYPNMLFAALATGGTAFIYDYDKHSILETADWLVKNRITTCPFPLAFLRRFLHSLPADYPSRFPDLRLINTGGEAMHQKDMKMCQARFSPQTTLMFTFSSTESGSMARAIYANDTDVAEEWLTFGMITPKVEVLIRDDQGRLATRDASGEIVIRSDGIIRGYWNRDELNGRLFMPDPEHEGKRLLLTGDMGRLDSAGRLEFTGRKDDMVKIRGFRIQLDAIDLQLRQMKGIKDAAAVAYQPPKGDKRLVAYLVASGVDKPSTSQLRAALSKRLPDYMVPSIFIWLESLPRNAMGKVVRKELPEPSNARPELGVAYEAPREGLERDLAAAWESLLGVEGVGRDDNFFELGGDSLLALQMTAQAEKILSQPVPQSFFSNATLANLASRRERTDAPESGRGKFFLSASRADGGAARRTPRASALKSALTRRYSLADLDRVVDSIVGRRMASLTYEEAREWAARWSRSAPARRMFYSRRFALFSRFVAGLEGCPAAPADIFPMNVLANLEYGLVRFLGDNWRAIRNDIEAIQRSRFPYWRSLARLIASASAEGLEESFPIRGLEQLLEARRAGKGVILLTFHGAASPIQSMVVAKRAGVDSIPTISHRIPARQSDFGDVTDELPFEVASSLNTEIALYAQRRLLDGQIVNVVADASDTHGRRYEATVGGRLYQFKAGFAELALNTGAAIVPHYGSVGADGRQQINFEPPLEATGDRAGRVERLVAAYAEFITRVWTSQPESAWWTRIRRHLSQPPAS